MSRTPPRKSVVEITRYSLQTVSGHSTRSVIISFLLPSVALSLARPPSSGVGMRSDGRAAHGVRGDSRSDLSQKSARSRLPRHRTDGETLPADEYWTDAPRPSAGRPPQWRPGLRCWCGYKRPG